MNTNFDDIDKTLNIEPKLVSKQIVRSKKGGLKKSEDAKSESELDYEYTRAQLYSLIEKGQEAIDGILEVSQQSDSPRAYEVAGQLIKSVADTADKLMDLQQKIKNLNKEEMKGPSSVTNNALFIGSTSDLQKFLKGQSDEKKIN